MRTGVRNWAAGLMAAAIGGGSTSAMIDDVTPDGAEREIMKIQQLAEVYNNAELVENKIHYVTDEELDAIVKAVADLKSVNETIDETLKPYFSEIKKGSTLSYRNLGGAAEHLRVQSEEYRAAVKKACSLDAISQDLKNVIPSAKMGVANKAPAYFKDENDIGRSIARARRRLGMLKSLESGSPDVAAAEKKIKETVDEVDKIKSELIEDIIAGNDAPPDNYQGPDRKMLLEALNAKWAKEGSGGEPVKVGISGSNWNRKIVWTIRNKTITKTETSKIQGWLVVKHDDKTVVRRSVNFVKDHLADDAIESFFVDDPKSTPEPGSLILATKIK
jgi:hypothetical protein